MCMQRARRLAEERLSFRAEVAPNGLERRQLPAFKQLQNVPTIYRHQRQIREVGLNRSRHHDGSRQNILESTILHQLRYQREPQENPYCGFKLRANGGICPGDELHSGSAPLPRRRGGCFLVVVRPDGKVRTPPCSLVRSPRPTKARRANRNSWQKAASNSFLAL